jgi:hypothetical protein
LGFQAADAEHDIADHRYRKGPDERKQRPLTEHIFEMEFRYVNPYRDEEEGVPEATANTIYTDLGVSTPASHIFGEGNDASGIIYGGHRLQDNGLNKAKAREVLKGILRRINTSRFHAVERFGRHAPLHTIFLV